MFSPLILGQPSSDPDDVDYVPSVFSFTRPPSDTVVARKSRLERRKAQKKEKREKKRGLSKSA